VITFKFSSVDVRHGRRSFLLETVQLDERDCVAIGECFQTVGEPRDSARPSAEN
jgi:hypothetical protein